MYRANRRSGVDATRRLFREVTMPIYEFVCTDCGHEFEKIQSFSDSSSPVCPQCAGLNVQRRMSAPAIHFKGSGWYITDSKNSSKQSANGKSGEGSGEAAAGDGKAAGESGASGEKSGDKASDKAGGKTAEGATKPAAGAAATSSSTAASSSPA
jgi:putative FmdB family regulatory protein